MKKLKIFALGIVLLTLLPWVCNSQTSESAYKPPTQLGAMIFGAPDSLKSKLAILDSVGVTLTRDSHVTTTWNGSSSRMQYWTAHGVKVLLNVNFMPQTSKRSFVSGDYLVDYLDALVDIIEKTKPAVVVIENEELNAKYYSGPIEVYQNQLKNSIDVAHACGVEVTNGGFTTRDLRNLTYRDLATYDSVRAAWFLYNCIPEAERAKLVSGKSPALELTISNAQRQLYWCAKSDLDYINVHLYVELINRTKSGLTTTENKLAGLQEILDYVVKVGGKPVICNEAGIIRQDYQLSYDFAKFLSGSGIKYGCFWSGGAGYYHKVRDDGSSKLSKNGKGLRDFIKTID